MLHAQGSFHHSHVHGNACLHAFPLCCSYPCPTHLLPSTLPCNVSSLPFLLHLVHVLPPPNIFLTTLHQNILPLLILFGCMTYSRIITHMCSEVLCKQIGNSYREKLYLPTIFHDPKHLASSVLGA